MDVNIFSGCHYFQWISLFSVHANAAMKEETLLETKTALLGNQPGDYTSRCFTVFKKIYHDCRYIQMQVL